jgi:protein-disulfide isomerase
MNEPWKVAAAGAFGGAILAVAAVFSAGQLGLLPTRVNEAAVHDYLLSHPQLLVEMSQALQIKEASDELQKQQAGADKLGLKAFFDPKIAFIAGPADAKNTLVEFFDYNCPFCRASVPALEKFYRAHQNDTRFAFIEFPIKGPESEAAARATLAARNQPAKYMDLHFALMHEESLVDEATVYDQAKKTGLDLSKILADMKNPAVQETITAAHALAARAGFNGTPTYIINGQVVLGALTDEKIKKLMKN